MYRKQMCRITVASLALPLAVAAVSLGQAADQANPGVQDSGMRQMNQTIISVRATKLIGMNVYNHQDKSLATIRDVIVDSGGQRVGYAVLSHGSVLGVGGKLFVIPYKDVEYSGGKDAKAYVSLSEEALKNAPSFDGDHWPDKTDATAYYKQVDEYFSKLGARTAGAQMDTGMGTETAMPQGMTWNRRVTSIVGANVLSPEGQGLGDIKDVVIDWNSGVLQYAVLSFGGTLGIGDKLFAIPPGQLKSKPDSKDFVLAIDKDRLKSAPGFDKDNWPNFADPTWRRTNDQFYTSPQ